MTHNVKDGWRERMFPLGDGQEVRMSDVEFDGDASLFEGKVGRSMTYVNHAAGVTRQLISVECSKTELFGSETPSRERVTAYVREAGHTVHGTFNGTPVVVCPSWSTPDEPITDRV